MEIFYKPNEPCWLQFNKLQQCNLFCLFPFYMYGSMAWIPKTYFIVNKHSYTKHKRIIFSMRFIVFISVLMFHILLCACIVYNTFYIVHRRPYDGRFYQTNLLAFAFHLKIYGKFIGQSQRRLRKIITNNIVCVFQFQVLHMIFDAVWDSTESLRANRVIVVNELYVLLSKPKL